MINSDIEKKLLQHLNMVIEANKTTNITRIDTLEEGMILHIEDSLSALPEIENAPAGRYGDLGSGAGYPGIPIALSTKRETTLIEARKKKADILDSFIRDLEISDYVRVFNGRAELLARKEAKRYSVLTARALSKLSVLMELASPLLNKGGLLVCYKAQISDEEYGNARRVEKMTGLEMVSDRELQLSDGITKRRIVCFEKKSKGTLKLPRKEGMAQKNPL